MEKVLFIECNSGISGDMFCGAMLDMLGSSEEFERQLAGLKLDGYEIKIDKVKKNGIVGTSFDVIDKKNDNHDSDMEYLYGHRDGESHYHEHSHEHSHSGEEVHSHEHHLAEENHSHKHVHFGDIITLIDDSDLSEDVKNTAKKIFDILAEAEAKAHGVEKSEVHFHEVGAVDSIVDVVSAAICFCTADVDRVVVSPLAEGHGTVRCQHGVLSIPVPAVTNIVAAKGLRLAPSPIEGELVTPTGAAIAAALRTEDELPAKYTIESVGTGFGKRNYEPVSSVRAMLLETDESTEGNVKDKSENNNIEKDGIWKLETDIDDTTPETLGYVMEKLYSLGAKEVHFHSIQMKKNRPGIELTVIAAPEDVEMLEDAIFTETTSIGIRKQYMERRVLPRRQETISTELGEIEVKVVTLPDGSERRYPEYESVRSIAQEKGVPLYEVMKVIGEM